MQNFAPTFGSYMMLYRVGGLLPNATLVLQKPEKAAEALHA